MIEYAFPTPIYHNRVGDFDNIQSKITHSISKLDFDYNPKWGKTHLITPTLTQKEMKRCGLNSLLSEIDIHLYQYCSDLNFDLKSYDICGWFSKFGKDNYAHLHHHGTADFAGVYYYRGNGEDGLLMFEAPNPYLAHSKCYSNSPVCSWKHTPLEGKILIFPGWLQHAVIPLTTNDERISFSFNVYVSR